LWEKLFIPPVAASALAYAVTKRVEDLREKLVAFWASWAGFASAIHVVLKLPPELVVIYPLLALSTGAFMYRGLRNLEDKGRARRGEEESGHL